MQNAAYCQEKNYDFLRFIKKKISWTTCYRENREASNLLNAALIHVSLRGENVLTYSKEDYWTETVHMNRTVKLRVGSQ